jgi:hypothetical protein
MTLKYLTQKIQNGFSRRIFAAATRNASSAYLRTLMPLPRNAGSLRSFCLTDFCHRMSCADLLRVGWKLLAQKMLPVVFLAALATPLAGQSQQSQILAQVEKKVIHLGDPVELHITLLRPEKSQALWPAWESSLGEWVVRKKSQAPATPKQAGWVIEDMSLEITAYKLGELEIPAVGVEVRQPDGRILHLQTNSIRMKIDSLLLSSDKDLRGIKPQADLPRDYQWVWWTTSLLLLLSLAGYWLYRRLKRKSGGELTPVPMEQSPDEEARKAIEKLEARNLIRRGLIKEYYFELSEIVKRYLGRRLKIPSLERTTEEFAFDLEHSQLLWDQRQIVRRFLEDCDLVKFARYAPSDGEIANIRQGALGIIERTEHLFVSGSASLVGELK